MIRRICGKFFYRLYIRILSIFHGNFIEIIGAEANNLKKYGFNIKRLKTGTPQRIKASSIDFSVLKEEKGDDTYWTFSFDTKPLYKINEQQKCYLVYTNENTHKIIRDNLKKSAMYGGYATGVGPRYCHLLRIK